MQGFHEALGKCNVKMKKMRCCMSKDVRHGLLKSALVALIVGSCALVGYGEEKAAPAVDPASATIPASGTVLASGTDLASGTPLATGTAVASPAQIVPEGIQPADVPSAPTKPKDHPGH